MKLAMEESKEKAGKIIAAGEFFVLSTASRKGQPESAVLLYGYDTKANLYFYTSKESRKYQNLIDNPLVSIVIYNDEGYLQIEGHVEELSGETATKARYLVEENKGGTSQYHDDPNTRWFKVEPTWIRMRVSGDYPPQFVVVKDVA